MHDNKLQSAELAEYAAQLTYEVHRVIRGRERLVDGVLKTALEQLQTYGVNHSRPLSFILVLIFRFSRLTETKDIMEEQVNLNRWQRIAKRRTLSDKLSTCKANLQYSMSTFAVGFLMSYSLTNATRNRKSIGREQFSFGGTPRNSCQGTTIR
jgi:hypothetical protein